MGDIAIVWFRNDLRIHDNEALTKAINNSTHVFPIYIFDERVFKGKTSFGFAKTGVHRARFIHESVLNLKSQLQDIGLDLYVDVGKPENLIYEIARDIRSSWVFANRERTQEEVDVQDNLEQALWTVGQEMVYTRGKMLYYTSDLPFPITQTPDVFTSLRKELEKYVPIRPPLPTPEKGSSRLPDTDYDFTFLPSIQDIGGSVDPVYESRFKGGETAGLEQLNYYLWDTDLVSNYKETRNELLGWDFSTKFSPYLASGCLSPKQIYKEIKKYEKQRTKNRSTYWVVFELIWRDFFRLMGKKYGNTIFQKGGIRKEPKDWSQDMNQFNKWAKGITGVPFIDANMRELNSSGFMSNRGRQNVASYLVHDLNIDWRIGAEYFESLLIDYDPCSNYGNWNYIAGIGNDPREDRYFNIAKQARRYDPEGAYIRHWLPELSKNTSPYEAYEPVIL